MSGKKQLLQNCDEWVLKRAYSPERWILMAKRHSQKNFAVFYNPSVFIWQSTHILSTLSYACSDTFWYIGWAPSLDMECESIIIKVGFANACNNLPLQERNRHLFKYICKKPLPWFLFGSGVAFCPVGRHLQQYDSPDIWKILVP